MLPKCLPRNEAQAHAPPFRLDGPGFRSRARCDGLSMKAISKRGRSKSTKNPRESQKTLEDAYRRVFVAPNPSVPTRERLSKYKSVPSVTTYGLFERPM